MTTANKFAGDLSSLYPQEVKLENTVDVSEFKFKGKDAEDTETVKLDANFN